MAGAGYKLFSTGDVLSASDVNTYLQQQTVMVFASAAARTTALASVLAEGMVTYLKDTDVVEIYTGAAWVSLDDPNAIQNSIVDAKGDIIAATADNTPARLAVGTNGQVLQADSSAATGLAYKSALTGLTTVTTSADSIISGITIGRGGGSFANVTVVGAGALAANAGQYNTAIGQAAMAANTTGAYNTAIGQAAMAANTTGQQSTAVGMIALNASNGSSNSAFGQFALGQVTSGAQNTGIGGYAGSNLLTGNNNIIIGQNAQASSTSVSNTVTLGDSSIATLRCQVTSITSLSDKRDKKDIAPLEHGLDFVKQLKPVSFKWNTRLENYTDIDGNEIQVQGKVGIADIGFIAQDIVALEDSLGAADSLQLSFRDNPKKLEVTQGRLIPILVKAIQDLSAKVAALEAGK